ncbi:MAG: hypothetical protein WA208_16890, partial [Thermoanaerobaculia bacterium]
IRILRSARTGQYVPPVRVARFYAQGGEREEAFEWLDRSLAERASGAAAFYTDPGWDLLRDDPRFVEYARKAGLPQVK